MAPTLVLLLIGTYTIENEKEEKKLKSARNETVSSPVVIHLNVLHSFLST
jgi:hypothetical protein